MTITQTTCPACGEPVAEGEACSQCGAKADRERPRVIHEGDRRVFSVAGSDVGLEGEEVELEVRIVDEWADLLTRKVFTAKVLDCRVAGGSGADGLAGEQLEQQWFLVEEFKKDLPRGLETLPRNGALPLREPIGQTEIEGLQICLYTNDAGVSLAELVALADRKMTVRQVADIFSAVLDGVANLHRGGILHLFLNPELIRIRLKGSKVGVPLADDRQQEDEDVGGDFNSAVGLEEETDLQTPAEESETERRESNEWKSEYEETQPQTPLRFRMAETNSKELGGLGSESTSLGEDTSEVYEDEISRKNWIRRLGIATSEVCNEDDETARSQTDKPVHAAEGTGLELEALFDSVSGLYSSGEVPRSLEVVPGFSAPEAYNRGGPQVDSISDVFSVGMVLYYLVAGRIPPASVYTRHAPAVPARNFRPAFPPGLDPVIKRATRPDPDKRYPDVEAMKRAFSSALEAIEDRSPERRETIPQMTVAVDRHIGIAKRERNPENQDNVFKGVAEDGAFGLTVVADGVSTASYGTGEVASRQLVESAEEVWNEILPAYLMEEEIREVETVDRILERANERIIDYINERHTPFTGSAHEVMGTTGLVALYHRGIITLGAVGDSRAYLQRGPGLEQLTIDHNLWTLSILEGLSADEALSMPRGDALARCLGTFVMNDEMLEPVPSGVDIYQIPVASGDTLLLTTDGLVDFAGGNVISSEENILATLLAEPDPALACLELILLANRGGGGDNIGLGVARFD